MMSTIGNNFVVRSPECSDSSCVASGSRRVTSLNNRIRDASRVMRKTQYARRNTRYGFTLVEIMVTTVILSLGLIMIYQAFFICLDTFNYYLNHLNVQLWMGEKIWQLEDDFRVSGVFSPDVSSDEFVIAGRDFRWGLDYGSIVADELYKVRLNVAWQQGARSINLSREAYVSNFAPKQE